MAPLSSLQNDLLANLPGSVQWNIALYPDSVLWVSPASHRRPDTGATRDALLVDPCAPLPEGVAVRLEPGDGVVCASRQPATTVSYSPSPSLLLLSFCSDVG